MNKKWQKGAGWAAICTAAALGVLLALTIITHPDQELARNLLVELGTEGIAALVFNATAVLGGGAIFFMAAFLFKLSKTKMQKAGSILLMLSGIALVGVGFFAVQDPYWHLLAASSFYNLTPLALITLGAGLMQTTTTHKAGAMTLAIGVTTALAAPFMVVPALQKIALMLFLAWTAWTGIYLLVKSYPASLA